MLCHLGVVLDTRTVHAIDSADCLSGARNGKSPPGDNFILVEPSEPKEDDGRIFTAKFTGIGVKVVRKLGEAWLAACAESFGREEGGPSLTKVRKVDDVEAGGAALRSMAMADNDASWKRVLAFDNLRALLPDRELVASSPSLRVKNWAPNVS